MAYDLDESLKKLQSLKKRPDGVTNKEWAGIRRGINELQKRKDSPFDPERYKAETQSSLAKLFIKLYFISLAVILFYVPLYNWLIISVLPPGSILDQISVRDTFMMISSAITPLLAFVLGHYFKGKD